MKKRFLLLVLLFVCLFALCAHAVSIRFEGEDEARLGGYMVVGESYKLYVDGYDSPDTVTFLTPDMENLQITDGNLVTVLMRDSDPDFMYRIRARDSVTGAIIVDRAVKLLTKADSMSVSRRDLYHRADAYAERFDQPASLFKRLRIFYCKHLRRDYSAGGRNRHSARSLEDQQALC